MREMKDSGVEWIGEIPVDWKLSKIKHHFSISSGTTPKSDEPEYWDGDIVWITPADFKTDDVFVSKGHRNLSLEGYMVSSLQLVPAGNIIFSKRAPIGQVVINAIDLCTNQGCLTVVLNDDSDVRFYRYIMSIATEEFELAGSGTTFKEISATSFGNILLPLTSKQEQTKCADYLDIKCSKIDEIIEKQQAIIEKLKEYKISIITEVVTKGLDYEVDYKESGTEWLGKIPSHWQYLSFKNVLKERNEKNFPVKTAERLSLSIDKGVTLYSEKTTNLDRFKDDVSQYKLAHEGDFVLNSMNMIVGAVGISHYFGCVSPAYYTYYDNEEDHITAKYCDYLFHSKTVKKVLHSLGKGIMSIDRGDDRINTCRLKVSRTDLRALKIPVPPICEQREIVKYLQSKENLIDKTIADRNKAIDKLQEYKKSLIYEVVTGKKEV